MLNLRYILRLAKAFVSRFKGIIFLGIGVGILIFFIFGIIAPRLFGSSRQVIGITGRYTVDTIPNEILKLIGNGLTKVSNEGIVEPDLAESWETPDNGKTWIFKLKDGLLWQDGKELDSESITYRFSDVEISTPDKTTIEFKLKEPFSPFPSVVSKPIFKKGLLSTGEWEVKKASFISEVVQSLELQNENKDKKIYKFYPTEEQTKLAYKLGSVDAIQGIFNNNPFDEWKTANIISEPNTKQVVTIFFNTQDNFLGSKSFRQALNYAINKEALSQNIATSPISPDSWGYNPQVKPYEYDLIRAKELLEETDNINEIEIKLSTSPVLLKEAEQIAKNWNDLGIKTSVQVTSVIPTEFQAYLSILDIPNDPDQYSFWHSTQTSTNISRFQNPRIDKLLEDGRTELNSSERKRIYIDFQRFLLEELPATFLFHPETYTILRK